MATEKVIVSGTRFKKNAYDYTYCVEQVPGKNRGIKEFRLIKNRHYCDGTVMREVVSNLDAVEIQALAYTLERAKYLWKEQNI